MIAALLGALASNVFQPLGLAIAGLVGPIAGVLSSLANLVFNL